MEYMAKTQKVMKRTQAKSKQKMDKLTALFMLGCVMETLLLVVHRFYVGGTGAEMMAMSRVLSILPVVGIILLVVGVVLHRGESKKLRPLGVYVAAFGGFAAVMPILCLKVNSSAAGMLAVVVPVAMLLAVVNVLYASDFFWMASAAAMSLGALWYWKRCAAINYLRLGAVVLMVLALAAVIAVAVLTMKAKKSNGVVEIAGRKFRMLENAAAKPVSVVVCGLCAVVLCASVVSSVCALYGTMLLGVVLFVAAVYYTVTAL